MKRTTLLSVLILLIISVHAQEKPVYGDLHIYGKLISDSTVKIQKYASNDTTFLYTHSDGTVDTVGITQLKAWMGTGSGVGVTYVGVTAPSQLSVSGSPIISTGTIDLSWSDTIPNMVFASPVSGSGKPQFRAIAAGDLPDIGTGYIKNQSAVTQTGNFKISGGGTLNTLLANQLTGLSYVEALKFFSTTDANTLITTRTATKGIVFNQNQGTGIEFARFDNTGKFGLGTTTPTARLSLLASKTADTLFKIRNSVTGNDSAFFVMPDGKVGINKNNPSYTLDVNGDLNIPSANSFRIGGLTAMGYGGVVTGGQALELGSNATWKALIYNSGNLGLGTSTPDEQLHLTGRIHIGQTTAPAVTTDKLYNVAGSLYWNALEISPQSKSANLVYASPNGSSGLPTWRKIYEDDIVMGSGTILVGYTGSVAKARNLSGDATISNLGALTIADNAVDGSDISLSGEVAGDIMKFNGTDWVHYADTNYCSSAGDTIYGNLTSTGQISSGGTYSFSDTIPVLNLRSGVLTIGAGDTTDHASTVINAGNLAQLTLQGTLPGQAVLQGGTGTITVSDASTDLNNDLNVSGAFTSNVYAQKNKIYQAATEPHIPDNAWAFWWDTANAKMYLVVDQAGTQFKVELQ